jgi:hypothetical protein
MGHLYSDGKAVDVNDAGSAVVNFGDLYRIGGITGIAMKSLATTDTVRDLALETSERVWKVKVPAGFAGAAGTYVYWSSGAGRKDGAVDLVSAPGTAGDRPIGVVVVAKNANGYAAVKMLLGGAAIA